MTEGRIDMRVFDEFEAGMIIKDKRGNKFQIDFVGTTDMCTTNLKTGFEKMIDFSNVDEYEIVRS